MLLDIIANKPLGSYYLQDLNDNIIHFECGKHFDVRYDWYKLVVEYPGKKLKIQDIVLDGQTFSHYNLTYMGWFKEAETGKRVSPGTTLYTQGQFEIWIHANYGVMLQSYIENVELNDISNELFEKYIHTVDKPFDIGKDYPVSISGFFAHGHGPQWWRKNSITTPYEVLDPSVLADVDRNKLHEEMTKMCEFNRDSEFLAFPKNNTELKGGRRCYRSSPYLPFTEIEDLPGEELQKLCRLVGFKRMLAVTLQTQYPGEVFAPHVDTHTEQETKMHLQGPCSFVLNLAPDTKDHYFKVGRSGFIPLDHGTFFNFNYAHATYNSSENIRPLCILFGERDNEINWYLNN